MGFRAWTKMRATELGLSGWVRNLAAGDVEATLCGPADAVEAMLAACREGPYLAKVQSVEVIGPADPYSGPFTIRD